MQQRYVIIGTRRHNDNVRLFLLKQEIVDKKENYDMFEMASNPESFMNKMEQKAILSQQPDTITISYDEWKKYKYKVDDTIIIDAKPENGKELE